MTKDTVVVDIDGCLNHYPGPLKMWAEVFLGLSEEDARAAIKEEEDFNLLKGTYRHSKILSYFSPREGAREVLERMKEKGYYITVLTARNPSKNPEIEGITRDWLSKYEIPYDSIHFAIDKYSHIRENEGRIVMIIEDEPEVLRLLKNTRAKIVVFRNDLNKHIKHKHYHVVSSWLEIESLFNNIIEK